jgi:hypothetical protein
MIYPLRLAAELTLIPLQIVVTALRDYLKKMKNPSPPAPSTTFTSRFAGDRIPERESSVGPIINIPIEYLIYLQEWLADPASNGLSIRPDT